MQLKQMIPYAKHLMEETIQKGDTVVDATAGNGNDTLFLAKLVGETGHVYSFDIQQTAIENTKQLLSNYNNTTIIHTGHENADEYIKTPIKAAMFNLGYLPKGNHEIITQAETTIKAIEKLIKLLKPEGIIVITVYHGHNSAERDELLKHLSKYNQKEIHVLKYEFINQKNDAPFIIAIEKRK